MGASIPIEKVLAKTHVFMDGKMLKCSACGNEHLSLVGYSDGVSVICLCCEKEVARSIDEKSLEYGHHYSLERLAGVK